MIEDKDALDLLRLQRAARIDELAARLHRLLDSTLAGPVTEEGPRTRVIAVRHQ